MEQVRSELLPLIEQRAGFKGFTLHVDRPRAKAVGTSYWESQDAMEASEEAVRGRREDAARSGGASDEPVVEHFEVALDTMA